MSIILRISLAFLSLLCCTGSLRAQYENIWAFGTQAGVDFNGVAPQAIKTAIATSEGSASICNDAGELLFYTDGTSVWDRTHKVMPNGNDLPGVGMNITSSTTQGTLIVPIPGDLNKYYIFSLGMEQIQYYLGRLYYSVVDMNLNNGLGDVIAGKKGIPLDSLLTEHMTAVSGNNCNIWLVAVNRIDNVFKSYNIDMDGIDHNAVISKRLPGEGGYRGILGSIDISPDGQILAIAQGNLYLYDFDAGSGAVSRPWLLERDMRNYYYGVCFSDDNSKLYASSGTTLQQYDLASGDSLTTSLSRHQLADGQFYPAIKRAPDGKVYTANSGKSSLNVVEKPGLAGAACSYVPNGFPLLAGTYSNLGLPNLATIVHVNKASSLSIDTVYCADSFLLTAVHLNGTHYTWDDDSRTPVRAVYESGTYRVRYNRFDTTTNCTEFIDSFIVVMYKDEFIANIVTKFGQCQSDSFILQAGNLSGTGYVWEDGSTAPERWVKGPGTYTVHYLIDPCKHYEEIFLVQYPETDPRVSFIADTLICVQELIQFQNTSVQPFDQFTWNFGDGQASSLAQPGHRFEQPGKYEVMLTGKIGGICADTTYLSIWVDEKVANDFHASPEQICIGEPIVFSSLSDHPSIVATLWQFGDGAETMIRERQVRHAYDINGIIPVSLITLFRACPDQTTNGAVSVFALPVVDLGADTALCFNGSPLVLYNRAGIAGALYHSRWSNGSGSDSIRVLRPGAYSLTVTQEPLGCSSTASVIISKNCYIDIPNAFTPNGDGRNDFFFPRQMMSHGVRTFRMQVFNPSGQVVFETGNREGRGWDGKLNQQAQPAGVYVYTIQVAFDDGGQETYHGNVTLIR